MAIAMTRYPSCSPPSTKLVRRRWGVIREIWLLRLRALLARAHGDMAGYRDYRDRYRTMAKALGFEGHIAMAEAM